MPGFRLDWEPISSDLFALSQKIKTNYKSWNRTLVVLTSNEIVVKRRSKHQKHQTIRGHSVPSSAFEEMMRKFNDFFREKRMSSALILSWDKTKSWLQRWQQSAGEEDSENDFKAFNLTDEKASLPISVSSLAIKFLWFNF